MSGLWKPQPNDVNILGIHMKIPSIIRDFILLILVFISWCITGPDIRNKNGFTWFPIAEVAKLFSGIFITVIPALSILADKQDIFKTLSSNVYFWLTGSLSGFLDNAPTYLVFFNTAGGDPIQLMGELSQTLLAISAGAVFMGANTYIGNAPNFMVKSISESSGIEMPSFFGFFIKWSLPILFPLFIIISVILF